MGEQTGGFPRESRLLRTWEFRAADREGQRRVGREFIILVAPVAKGPEAVPWRLGVTVSKKVGNAVVRNRVKRRVREWFRTHRRQLRTGIDLVVVARRPAAALCGRDVDRALGSLVDRELGMGR